MTKRTLLVTGASGHLGREAVRALLDRDQEHVIAGTRDPAKVAELAAAGAEVRQVDFDDPAGMALAFAGVDRLLLVSTDALDRPGQRAEQHRRAIAAAAEAGVKHIAYTSFTNPSEDSAVGVALDHRLTEEALASSGVGYTALRNNLHTDLLLQAIPQAIESGQLVTARGDGAISYVTRSDCAQAAASALADTFDGVRALEVTGPSALTGAELARIASDLSGKSVQHVPIPAPALHDGMVEAGLPEPVAALLVSFEVAAERGEIDTVSDTVVRLTGRRSTTVRDFLAANLDLQPVGY